jgi:hypothetical protein
MLSPAGSPRRQAAAAPNRLLARTAAACLLGSVSLLGTGCVEDKKANSKIEELERDALYSQEEKERLEQRVSEMRNEVQELRQKLHQAERNTSQAANEVRNLTRELERTRRTHESDLERARRAAPALNLAEMKSKFAQNLAAIATITGDTSSGRGTIVRDGDKTWLYGEPGLIGGNTKLTVTLPSGEAITKFGAFQIAADSPLVRLEILEEVPNAFELDTERPVDEATRLLAVSFPPTGEPQVIEGSPLEIEPNGFGMNVYGTKSSGDPVVAADNAKLVAILVDADTTGLFATDIVREEFQSQRPRAFQINRPINWVDGNIAAFIADHAKIQQMNQTTLLLNALAQISYADNNIMLGASVPGSNQSVEEVLAANAGQASVAELAKLRADLAAAKLRISERDMIRRVQQVIGGTVNTAKREIIEFNAARLSPFHKPHAEQAIEARKEAEKAVAAMLEGLGN